MYLARQTARFEKIDLNHHTYHLRRWGNPNAPLLVLLHGWMDASPTFQFMVDALQEDWNIVAPDWRGFGHSAWNAGSYYFPDYLADLDALLTYLSPDAPVLVAGHSMGSMVAALYAGIRPERVARLVSIEGFGLADASPEDAPPATPAGCMNLPMPLTLPPSLALRLLLSDWCAAIPTFPLTTPSSSPTP